MKETKKRVGGYEVTNTERPKIMADLGEVRKLWVMCLSS